MKSFDLIGGVIKGTWDQIYDDDLVKVSEGHAIFGKLKQQSYLVVIKKFNFSVTLPKTDRNEIQRGLSDQGEVIRTWVFKELFRAAVVDRIDAADFIEAMTPSAVEG